MLVLTRKQDECLLIEDGIEIKVLSVKGSRVKLGINAPNHVGIRRAELTLPTESALNEADTVGPAAVAQRQLFED